MATTFSEAQKNDIRRWMGASHIFTQMWPKLENAMTMIYATSDNGSQIDDSAVILVQGWLTQLDTLEQAELNLSIQMAIVEAGTDKVKLDAAGNGLYGLRKIMRRYIGHMSDIFSCKPLRDVFEPAVCQYEQGQEQRSFSDYGV
jgi:hypothetical protein